MRNTWTVIDDNTGLTRISIIADTDARGVCIEQAPDWQSYTEIEHIVGILNTANDWLMFNGGTS